MPSQLPRVRARLSSANHDRLIIMAQRSAFSQSQIINRALSRFFKEEENDARDGAIIDRLDLMTRHDARHSRDLGLVLETLSLFVHYFFTVTPDVPQTDKEARAAAGVSHFNGFLEHLSGRMSGGGKTIKNALDDVLMTDADFFTPEELERLKLLDQKASNENTPTLKKRKAKAGGAS